MSTTIAATARWSSLAHLYLLSRRRLPLSAPFSSAAQPDLSGYFRKVDMCNRGMDKKGNFVEFLVEEQVVGYVHRGFTELLIDFHDTFTIVSGNNGSNTVEHVKLHSSLKPATT